MTTNTADSGATDPNGPDAFDQAMAEFTAPESAPAQAAGQQSEGQSEPPAPDLTSPPVTNPGGSEPPAGNPAPAGDPTDDVWKDVPEAARKAYEQSQAAIASLKGRVSAEARRANQLQRQLAQAPAGSEGSQQGNQDGGAAPANELLDSEKLKRFQEDYPEIADPFVSTISALQARIDQLAAPVNSIAQAQVEADHLARYDALAEQHPDWQQYATDARWGEFLENSPRFIQEMHARNVDVSDPEEAAFVLSQFKGYIGAATTPASVASTSAPAPTVDPRRQRQLDAGRDAGASGAGAAVQGVPNDLDAALAVYIAQDDKARASLNR